MMLAMDLQTMLIGLVVFLISALLIYLILALTMRETTFEQVMEEQKRKQEAQFTKPKEQKKDKKKKFKKGKASDKGQEEPEKKEEERFKEQKMVELEIDPSYVDVSDSGSASTPPKKTKAGKAAQAKPILTNKDEKVLVAKEAPELFHRKNVPKDAVELKHEREQLSVRNGKEEIVVKAPELPKPAPEAKKVNDGPRAVEPQPVISPPELQKVTAAQPVKKDVMKKKKAVRDVVDEPAATEIVEKATSAKLMSSVPELVNGCEPSLKTIKKTKTHDLNKAEFLTSDGDSLLATVQFAQLSDGYIRNLVEVLLGKLSNSDEATGFGDWTKKGNKADPMTQLQRQVEEKDRALEEEQQRCLAGNAKIKELNQELMNERQKFATLAKLNQDQNGEIQAMKARMQESHGQHLSEINHYRSQLETKAKQANEGMNQAQRLKEENKILQDAVAKAQHLAGAEKTIDELRQKVTVLDSALQQLSKQLNAAENGKKTSENKAKQFEERIHDMEASLRESQAMAQRYKELSDELHKSESRMNSLNLELRRSEDDKAGCITELKTKEAQLNELNRHVMLNNSKIEELLKNNQQKDSELQNLKAELQEARTAMREVSYQQQNTEKVEATEAGEQADQINDKIIAEKDETLRQINAQLDEKLKELTSFADELESVKGRCSDLEREKGSLQRALDERDAVAGERSNQQNAAIEELSRAKTKLESESLAQSQELSRCVGELQQKEAEVEKLRHESSSKSQELSRLVNELLQKDVEVGRTKNEVDALRNDNAVLNDCRLQCEELKTSLVSLKEQLQEKEAKQIESEAYLMQLREKEAQWVGSEASHDVVRELEERLLEQNVQLQQLKDERTTEDRNQRDSEDVEKKEMAKRLEEDELRLKQWNDREVEWHQKEDEWYQKEAEWANVDAQLKQLRETASQAAAELSQIKERESKNKDFEAELKRTLEATEATLAERDLQLRHLQEVNTQVVETELQLMELRQKSLELQKLNEKYGSLEQFESRLLQQAEKEAKLVESERNSAENETKLRQMEEELMHTKSELEELRQHVHAEETVRSGVATGDATVATSSPCHDRRSPEAGKHREVTVFTHVQEKASWDMSKLVLDLDTKAAEIQILQSLLGEKEATVQELVADKTRLMDMIENMQMELWAKEKQVETAKNNLKYEEVEQELTETRQAQTSLQAEVIHYQTILADTERILRELENNIDNEERKWREKYETVIEEKDSLIEELTRLKVKQEEQSVNEESSDL